jgi:hypothetical protein
MMGDATYPAVAHGAKADYYGRTIRLNRGSFKRFPFAWAPGYQGFVRVLP